MLLALVVFLGFVVVVLAATLIWVQRQCNTITAIMEGFEPPETPPSRVTCYTKTPDDSRDDQ